MSQPVTQCRTKQRRVDQSGATQRYADSAAQRNVALHSVTPLGSAQRNTKASGAASRGITQRYIMQRQIAQRRAAQYRVMLALHYLDCALPDHVAP